MFNALNNAPTFAVKERNGEYTLAEGLGNEVINPLAQVENNFNQIDVNKISGKLGASYVFLNDFTAETSFQFNYAEVKGKIFIPTVFYGSGKVFNNTGRPTLLVNKDISYVLDEAYWCAALAQPTASLNVHKPSVFHDVCMRNDA